LADGLYGDLYVFFVLTLFFSYRNTKMESENGEKHQGVKVSVRIRPLNAQEIAQGCDNSVRVGGALDGIAKTIALGPKTMEFDAVFDANSTQAQVYTHSTLSLLEGFFTGYNATIFAYGQTGSGKTFTMGSEFMLQDEDIEYRGVIPRVMKEVLERAKLLYEEKMTAVVLKLSYLEIFNDDIYDLLVERQGRTSLNALSVRDDGQKGIVVNGLIEHEVKSIEQVAELMKLASSNRATAATSMNATSSRSHAICTLSMEQHPVSGIRIKYPFVI